MPGDRQETREFIEKSRANTRVHLELNVPNVHAILPSKEFFELIYNRYGGIFVNSRGITL